MQALLLLVLTLMFLFLSLFIYVEFGWKTYVLVDCNPALRCKYTRRRKKAKHLKNQATA